MYSMKLRRMSIMQYLYNCDQRRRKGKTLKREEGGNKKLKKKMMKKYRLLCI